MFMTSEIFYEQSKRCAFLLTEGKTQVFIKQYKTKNDTEYIL